MSEWFTRRRRATRAGTSIALTLFIVLAAPARAGDPVALKYRLKQGKTYRLKMLTTKKTAQQLMGQGVTTEEMTGFSLSFRVTRVEPNGNMNVTVRFESIYVRNQSMLGMTEYNSDASSQPTQPLASAFAGLLHRGFDIVLTPTGRVASVNGAEKLLRAMMQNMKAPEGPLGGPMKELLAAQIKEQFSADALKQGIEYVTAVYPDHAVAVGDSWSCRTTARAEIPLTLDTAWTLKSESGNRVELAAKSKIKSASQSVEAGPMKMECDLSGDQTGTLTIDKRTGWPRSGEFHRKLSGSMRIANPQGGEALSMPMSIEAEIKFKIPKPPAKVAATQPKAKKP